ncbi:MAG TPA: CsbD family protein [Candidatus Angelobacter sp.]
MDKDRVKGKMEEVGGRIERQTGEWTGNPKTQAKGLKKEVKGKARNAVGQVKDAARDALDRNKDERDIDDMDRERGAA